MGCACPLCHFIQRALAGSYECTLLHSSLDCILLIVYHSGANAVCHNKYTIAFTNQIYNTLQPRTWLVVSRMGY